MQECSYTKTDGGNVSLNESVKQEMPIFIFPNITPANPMHRGASNPLSVLRLARNRD